MKLKFKAVRELKKLPKRATAGSAGIDLRAVIGKELVMRPGRTYTIPTGIAVEIPYGYVGLLFIRSGVSKHGVRLKNSVGVIDSDYRGEVKALVQVEKKFVLKPYVRFCQLVVVPCVMAEPAQVDELSETERGEGGEGSTGGFLHAEL